MFDVLEGIQGRVGYGNADNRHCDYCLVAWHDDEHCWMCGRPGSPGGLYQRFRQRS